ncbi:MAG: DUF4332 domain-containing protein [Symploca sp. SIO2B6]|nr:DUF4332 domain-containing protein [Symploca sp. SIO2B6]
MGLDNWQQRLSGVERLEPSNWPIEQLPGLSDEQISEFQQLGVKTTLHLLHNGRTPEHRQAIANHFHLHVQHVNKWIALANLAQVPSVGCMHCGHVLHAGIASPRQLAQTSVGRLHPQIMKLHVAEMQRQDLCPKVEEVNQWISEAQKLTTSS